VNLPILILQGRIDTRGHFSGSKSRQEGILSVATSPFVLMLHDTTEWARNFPPYGLKIVLQQPRPKADIGRIIFSRALLTTRVCPVLSRLVLKSSVVSHRSSPSQLGKEKPDGRPARHSFQRASEANPKAKLRRLPIFSRFNMTQSIMDADRRPLISAVMASKAKRCSERGAHGGFVIRGSAWSQAPL
jgi:hypothetical protein